MAKENKKQTKNEEPKVLTNAQKIEALQGQQEQLRETFLKIQGAIELLQGMEAEGQEKEAE
tara:strand:- start:21269 stop:21451 length:183 start_codon:yes stop_codon:yes gene_type:complete